MARLGALALRPGAGALFWGDAGQREERQRERVMAGPSGGHEPSQGQALNNSSERPVNGLEYSCASLFGLWFPEGSKENIIV